MKVKHYLETIANIEIFPLISLVLFTAFFAGVVWYVIKMDKKTIETVSNLPLEDDNSSNSRSQI